MWRLLDRPGLTRSDQAFHASVLPGTQALVVDCNEHCFWFRDSATQPAFNLPAKCGKVVITSDGRSFACVDQTSVLYVDMQQGKHVWRTELNEINDFVMLSTGDEVVGCMNGMTYRITSKVGTIVIRSAQRKSASKAAYVVSTGTLEDEAVFSRPLVSRRVWFIYGDARLLVFDQDSAAVVHPSTGQNLLTLAGRFDGKVAVSPDGRWLATERGNSVSLLRLRWD